MEDSNNPSTQAEIQLGEQLKTEGMARAEEARLTLKMQASRVAVLIAESRENRQCTIDDVQIQMENDGMPKGALGNAAGSVFSGGRWDRVDSVPSVRAISHRRRVTLWKLR